MDRGRRPLHGKSFEGIASERKPAQDSMLRAFDVQAQIIDFRRRLDRVEDIGERSRSHPRDFAAMPPKEWAAPGEGVVGALSEDPAHVVERKKIGFARLGIDACVDAAACSITGDVRNVARVCFDQDSIPVVIPLENVSIAIGAPIAASKLDEVAAAAALKNPFYGPAVLAFLREKFTVVTSFGQKAVPFSFCFAVEAQRLTNAPENLGIDRVLPSMPETRNYSTVADGCCAPEGEIEDDGVGRGPRVGQEGGPKEFRRRK